MYAMENPIKFVKPSKTLASGTRTINGELWKWEILEHYNDKNKHDPYIVGDIIGPVNRQRPYGSRHGISPNFFELEGKPTKRQRIKGIKKCMDRFFAQLDEEMEQ